MASHSCEKMGHDSSKHLARSYRGTFSGPAPMCYRSRDHAPKGGFEAVELRIVSFAATIESFCQKQVNWGFSGVCSKVNLCTLFMRLNLMHMRQQLLKTGLSLLILVVILWTECRAQSSFRFKSYQKEYNTGSDQPHRIIEDGLGFIWFNDNFSITRFDGYNFKTYLHVPGDSLFNFGHQTIGADTYHRQLFVDWNGEVWFNCATSRADDDSHVIMKYDRVTDGFIRFKPKLNGASVWDMRFEKGGNKLWIATLEQGLFEFDLKSKETRALVNPHNSKQGREVVMDILDRGPSLLVLTSTGFWELDKATNTYKRPNVENSQDSLLLFTHHPFHFMENKIEPGTVWVVETLPTAETVFLKLQLKNTGLTIIQRLDVPSQNSASDWVADAAGVIWISTLNDGLYRLDPKDSDFTIIRNRKDDPFSIVSNSVGGIIIDKNENIWVSTSKGIGQLRKQKMRFYNTLVSEWNSLNAVALIGSGNNEQIILLQSRNDFSMLPFQFKDSIRKTFSFGLPWDYGSGFSAFWKGKNRAWISASYQFGVLGFPLNASGGITPKVVTKYVHIPGNPNSLPEVGITAVYEDSFGFVWVGTGRDLYRIDPRVPYGEAGCISPYSSRRQGVQSPDTYAVSSIVPEDESSFWIVTLGSVDLYRDGKILQIFNNGERMRSILRSQDGSLYVGTERGLFQGIPNKSGEFEFHKIDEVPEVVSDLAEDRLGRIWITGFWGLACYDRRLNTLVRLSELDGIAEPAAMGTQSLAISKKGMMVYKGVHGISILDPTELKISPKAVSPLFTELRINNNVPVLRGHPAGNEDFSMDTSIIVLNHFTLDYQHNNFSIRYAAMDLNGPEKNKYQHQLVGYDKSWIASDWTNRTATYTSLPAGDYTFKVRASNEDGIWSDVERKLSLTVLPPPWQTNWAYAGYGLLVVAMLFIARRTVVQRERLKSQYKLEHVALEKAREVDKAKTAFFTNISHEFRTPLTLIKGPVQDLLEEFSSNKKISARLQLVQHNADQLFKLVNQLLSLAKLEAGALKVEAKRIDLREFLEPLANSFSALALHRNLEFRAKLPRPGCRIEIDTEKVEMILSNLLGNALKYTSSPGQVKFEASADPGEARLVFVVTDTGIGIAPEDQQKIFERFYQVNDGNAHTELGAGIGLALVKELTEMLGGQIKVESQAGKGSQFTFILPAQIDMTSAPVNGELPGEDETSLEAKAETQTKAKLLVVEDNQQLRTFIVECFGGEFEIFEAADGKQGFELALLHCPELIVSDVMMPVLDGVAMTSMIRKDPRINHIPVIMLTAKAAKEDKLEGLEYGAVDYITKPFDKKELIYKVRNIVESHTRGREKFRLELLGKAPGIQAQSLDEKFLVRLKDAIHARLADENLSVDFLAEEIGFSRAQLYRKVKAVTGMPVNELIRHYRMHRAAQLLQQGWGAVSQVAYEVGYSNPSYFSKIFKEEFGVLPSEYEEKVERMP
jgi:signal transduction histidine kinase/DNA-binding response OmpR family regulator